MSKWSAKASMAQVMRSASRGWPGSRSAGSGSSTRRFASSSSTRSGNCASFLAMSGRPNCLATPSRNSATVVAGSKCSATSASVSSGVRQLRIFSTVTCMVRREASPSFASGSLIFASASFVSPGAMPTSSSSNVRGISPPPTWYSECSSTKLEAGLPSKRASTVVTTTWSPMATPRSSAISWYSARGSSSFSIWASTRLAGTWGFGRSSSTGSYEVSVYFFMFSSPLGCLLSLACIYTSRSSTRRRSSRWRSDRIMSWLCAK